MKKKYIVNIIFSFLFSAFLGQQVIAQQFKLLVIDPTNDIVTIKNFGTTTENVGTYRLCSRFGYRTLTQTTIISGSFNLAPDGEVTVSIPNYLNDTSADVGLYLPTGNFGTAANMIDFMQYGASFNSGGRESQAVANGFWTAGTFLISEPNGYAFAGEATDFGMEFWATLLSTDGFEEITKFNISPNPASLNLNVNIPTSIENATLRVFDLLGKNVLVQEVGSLRTISIDVSKWNTGVYIVRVSSDDLTQTKRFIKQ